VKQLTELTAAAHAAGLAVAYLPACPPDLAAALASLVGSAPVAVSGRLWVGQRQEVSQLDSLADEDWLALDLGPPGQWPWLSDLASHLAEGQVQVIDLLVLPALDNPLRAGARWLMVGQVVCHPVVVDLVRQPSLFVRREPLTSSETLAALNRAVLERAGLVYQVGLEQVRRQTEEAAALAEREAAQLRRSRVIGRATQPFKRTVKLAGRVRRRLAR